MKPGAQTVVDRGSQAVPTPQAMARRYKTLEIDATVAEFRANCIDKKVGRLYSAKEAVMALGPVVVGPLLRAAKREPKMYSVIGPLLQEMANARPGSIVPQHVPAILDGLAHTRSKQRQNFCEFSYVTYVALRDAQNYDARGIVPLLLQNLETSRGETYRHLFAALCCIVDKHPGYAWQNTLRLFVGNLTDRGICIAAFAASALKKIAIAHPEYPEWANAFGDMLREWAWIECREGLTAELVKAKDDLQDALDTLRERNEGCRRIDVKKLFDKPRQ